MLQWETSRNFNGTISNNLCIFLTKSMEQCPFEKLIVTQLAKKFPAFYTAWKFNTVFTRFRHWSLSWDRWIQSTPSHPFPYQFSLFSHLRPRWVVSSVQVFSPIRDTCSTHLIVPDLVIMNYISSCFSLYELSNYIYKCCAMLLPLFYMLSACPLSVRLTNWLTHSV